MTKHMKTQMKIRRQENGMYAAFRHTDGLDRFFRIQNPSTAWQSDAWTRLDIGSEFDYKGHYKMVTSPSFTTEIVIIIPITIDFGWVREAAVRIASGMDIHKYDKGSVARISVKVAKDIYLESETLKQEQLNENQAKIPL